jgi:acetyltransferase-like isoleucine patch superfamily enzyme
MKAVDIGKRAFIGGHCIILKGTRIGEAAVVGAGATVTNEIPPFEVWAGRPARFLRRLDLPKDE